MLIGCLLMLAAVLLLPRFGFGAASSSFLFGLLMLVCCVGPMLLMLLGRGRKGDGTVAKDDGKGEPPTGGSCH